MVDRDEMLDNRNVAAHPHVERMRPDTLVMLAACRRRIAGSIAWDTTCYVVIGRRA
jgi:hypothetical protein